MIKVQIDNVSHLNTLVSRRLVTSVVSMIDYNR